LVNLAIHTVYDACPAPSPASLFTVCTTHHCQFTLHMTGSTSELPN